MVKRSQRIAKAKALKNVGQRKQTRSRTRSQRNGRHVQSPPVTRRTNKSLGGRKQRRANAFANVAKWTYVGCAEEEKGELQTAKKGDTVELDFQIYDDKLNACGTRFVFDRYADGLVHGHIETPSGVMQLKKTAGHVSVCHASALEPNSGNIGRRKRRKRPTPKVADIVRNGSGFAKVLVSHHRKKNPPDEVPKKNPGLMKFLLMKFLF